MSVVMPPMTRGQREAWSGLLDQSERHPTGWTLVGGQMVHLHCIERGVAPTRPTDDVDTVLDVRAEPGALQSFRTALVELGFASTGDLRKLGTRPARRVLGGYRPMCPL